jgi:tetratricopeptide (TPR) repeat protein
MKYSLLLGCTLALAICADMAAAQTVRNVADLQNIARASTVKIKLQKNGTVGSGVIIDRAVSPKGNLYTLVTNRHVVCGDAGSGCAELPTGESYSLNLVDGQSFRVNRKDIKLLSGGLDLAVVQFRSNRKYTMASVADTGSLQASDLVYTAGFPDGKPSLVFGVGKVLAAVNKRLVGDAGGYSIIYDAKTLPGMSGGGVFNVKGQLVAIHGYGDRYKPGTDLNNARINTKIGYNRGIPVRWLVQGLDEFGIKLNTRSSSMNIRAASLVNPATADEYYIAGFNKYVEPGDNILAGKRQAIQLFSMATKVKPKYANAYFARGYVYTQIQDWQKGIDDFNQALTIDPTLVEVYYNRGIPKTELGDLQGALADYNQSISISPEFADAYHNRGHVKRDLKDFKGALNDFSKAITLNPTFTEAYFNRGNLRYLLKDTSGAMTDFNQAIVLNPQDGRFYVNRGGLKYTLGDSKGAINDLNKSIVLNPKDLIAYYTRGQIRKQLKDLKGAIEDFSQVIVLNPQDANAYYNRASAKNGLNDFQGAVNDFNQVLLLTPQAADAYYSRGLIKVSALNDREGGIKDLRQAVKLSREQRQDQILQSAIKQLRKLGVTD